MTEQHELPERLEDFTPAFQNALLRVSFGEITADQAREIIGLKPNAKTKGGQ